MKRSDFLKATLLAPLAGLFGWKPKPDSDESLEWFKTWRKQMDGPEPPRLDFRSDGTLVVDGYACRYDFFRDSYIATNGREYASEQLTSLMRDRESWIR